MKIINTIILCILVGSLFAQGMYNYEVQTAMQGETPMYRIKTTISDPDSVQADVILRGQFLDSAAMAERLTMRADTMLSRSGGTTEYEIFNALYHTHTGQDMLQDGWRLYFSGDWLACPVAGGACDTLRLHSNGTMTWRGDIGLWSLETHNTIFVYLEGVGKRTQLRVRHKNLMGNRRRTYRITRN